MPKTCKGAPRCFIVRVDEELNAELEAHRDDMARWQKCKVSLAAAARDLFGRALVHKRGPAPKKKPSAPQLDLFKRQAG